MSKKQELKKLEIELGIILAKSNLIWFDKEWAHSLWALIQKIHNNSFEGPSLSIWENLRIQIRGFIEITVVLIGQKYKQLVFKNLAI